MKRVHGHGTGFSLVELLVALAIGALLTVGTVRLAQATTASVQLQQNLAALEENARFALQMIRREAEQAGYRPRPWLSDTSIEALAGSSDNLSPSGDLLVFRRWSDRNCYENPNPSRDGNGRALFYLRITRFRISAGGQLALDCEYGPDADQLIQQVRGLGLVEHVAALHAQYAEDADHDGNADFWVRAGGWASDANILGMRAGLILLSPERVSSTGPAVVGLLDETATPIPAGALHRTLLASWVMRGRVRS